MIDAVYCISLERLFDRRKRAIQLLSQIDFCPVYFLDAVDAEKFSKEDFNKEGIFAYEHWELPEEQSQLKVDNKSWNMVYWQRPVNMGEIGCTVSHYMVWKHSYENMHKNVLIFEDDIEFEYDELLWGLSVYGKLIENNDCDLFYLGSIPFIDSYQVNQNVIRCEYAYLLHSYILSRDAMRILINANLFVNLIVSDEFVPAACCNHPRRDIRDLYSFERKLKAYRLSNNVVNQTDLRGSQTA